MLILTGDYPTHSSGLVDYHHLEEPFTFVTIFWREAVVTFVILAILVVISHRYVFLRTCCTLLATCVVVVVIPVADI